MQFCGNLNDGLVYGLIGFDVDKYYIEIVGEIVSDFFFVVFYLVGDLVFW